MQFWELYDYLKFLPYADRSSWEQTRFISLMIAQKFCKKRLKLKDMFELPWDDVRYSIEMSKDEEEKNRYFQEYVLQMINKKTDNQNHG